MARGTHKVQKGETIFTIARQYYGSDSAAKYISQANGGVTNARIGSILQLPRVTMVGEQGAELLFQNGKQTSVVPAQESAQMLQSGLRPDNQMYTGGLLIDGVQFVNQTTSTTSLLNALGGTTAVTKPPKKGATETTTKPPKKGATETSTKPTTTTTSNKTGVETTTKPSTTSNKTGVETTTKPTATTVITPTKSGVETSTGPTIAPVKSGVETSGGATPVKSGSDAPVYTDTIRVPGQAPSTIQSQAPTQNAVSTAINGIPGSVMQQNIQQQNVQANYQPIDYYQTPTAQPTSQPHGYYDFGLGVTSYGADNFNNSPTGGNIFADTYRQPGQTPTTILSQGPGHGAQVNPSGTFSDTSIGLWNDYFFNPQNVSDVVIEGVNAMLTGPNSTYPDVYNRAVQNVLIGVLDPTQNLDAYGNQNTPPIPSVLVPYIDVQTLDPEWYNYYSSLGYEDGQIIEAWLAALGYEYSDSGMMMEYVGNGGDSVGGGSAGGVGGTGGTGGGGGGGGGHGYFGGYGGGNGYSSMKNSLDGLVTWRGVSFA